MRNLPYLNRAGKFASGNPRYYFRRPGEKNIPMPDAPQDSMLFREAYEAARLHQDVHFEPQVRRRDLHALERIQAAMGGAAYRAQIKGLEFDLTFPFLTKMFHDQKKRCALTGMAFHKPVTKHTSGKDPYAPSIDRIAYDKGIYAR